MKQGLPHNGKIALIGVPSSAGARNAGQELAPKALRDAGLLQGLIADGHAVLDLGDTDVVSFAPDTKRPRQQNLPLVVSVLGQVERQVDAAMDIGAWPLVVGGDCTITIGVLASLCRHFPGLGMIYLDGDVDLNTPDTTLSGILDGMVLAHVLGKGAAELSHFASRCPLLAEEDITLFGYSLQAGGLDPVEIELLRHSRLARFPYHRIKDAVKPAARRALSELERSAEHILVHFDVDVIDRRDFPAADVPHQPGLGIAQVRDALEVFLGSDQTIGLVVTEFNAGLDGDGRLAKQLAELLRSAGGRALSSKVSD